MKEKKQNFATDYIRNLVIIALASDDMLMETLVLKGGNAIDLLRPANNDKLSRTSYDLDFSIENDFEEDFDEIVHRFERTIDSTFAEKDLIVFDFSFAKRPSKISENVSDFWGGYFIEFKIVTSDEYRRLGGDLEKLRRGAISIRPNQSKKIEIDISKFEYVTPKIETQLEGYKFYIYSAQMIVLEKIRAICQQLPAYAEIVPSHKSRPRARDFYDIHLILEQHSIDFSDPALSKMANHIFQAKKVPLEFILSIEKNVDIHRQDWQNVLDTLPASEKQDVKEFDYYLSFLMEHCLLMTSQ